MKSGSAQIFLIIAISLFIPMFSACAHYCNLAEANLFSADLSFENPDQEDLLVDHHKESKAPVSSVFSVILLPRVHLFDQLPRFFISAPSFDEENFVLRC